MSLCRQQHLGPAATWQTAATCVGAATQPMLMLSCISRLSRPCWASYAYVSSLRPDTSEGVAAGWWSPSTPPHTCSISTWLVAQEMWPSGWCAP